MQTKLMQDGTMIIIIPKEEKQHQIQHLESLEPLTDEQYDEITIILNILNKKPNLRLVN